MPEEQNIMTADHIAGCDCAGCVGFDGLDVVAVYANVDGQGGTLSGKPVYSLEQVIANLNRTNYPGTGIPGPMWSYDTPFMGQNKSGDPNIIYYGFYQAQSQLFQVPYVYQNASGQLVGRAEYFGFAPFSAAQQNAARMAIALWDDLIKVSFVEKTDATQADITYGNLTNAPGTQAYAYFPYNYGGTSAGLQGDVWVSLSQASNLQLFNGGYGYATLIHETGHAIGLQHPGAYNAAPGLSITYPVNAEYYQDTRQYTQMSYFNSEFSGAGHIDWDRVNWTYGQTPLLHDIATIQAIYGADPTTRAGDTVYGFNSNAGRDVYDFTINTMPVISIYDASGDNDMLDFSGWNTPSKIDLNPGAFSSGGGSGVVPLDVLKARGLLPASYTEEQYLALRARYNAVDGLLHDNISIAYNTIIENAKGGGGDDTIFGNAVANILEGGAGNDTIDGRDGNDKLLGGIGNDILIGSLGDDTLDGGVGADQMTGGIGNDFYIVDDAGDVLTELLGEGTDTVSSSINYTLGDNLDNLVLTDSAQTGTGNGLDNVITGNAVANILSGGAGNDTLIGGDGIDRLAGGTGADTFVAELNSTEVSTKRGTLSLDMILDFNRGEGDRIDLSGLGEDFHFVGKADGKVAGDLSWKSYGNVNAAEAALGFDIDGLSGKGDNAPVSIIFGHTDNDGIPDFAIVLFNTPTVEQTDFIYG